MLFEILIKPAQNMFDAHDAPVCAAGARHAVELIRVTHELGIHTQTLQRHKHLLALFDRATQVIFIMLHQRWCFGIADIFHR